MIFHSRIEVLVCSVFHEDRKVMISKELPSGRRMSPCIFLYALEGPATAQASAGSWFTNSL